MKPQKFSINDILARESPGGGNIHRKLSDVTNTNESIPALPTPPHSPELARTTKCSSKPTKSPTTSSSDVTGKRKRDPIGQILDSLCSESNNASASTPSAFSPIITSACSQLSPLTMLAHCERRCYLASPGGINCSQQGALSMPLDQLSLEQLNYLEAQRLVHHQQSQQQRQHHSLSTMAPNPFVLQHNPYQLQMIRDQQLNVHQQAPAAPLWMTWLRSSAEQMTSLPLKESRIPPPPRYQCDSCKKSYSTFGGLTKHKQFHCVSHVKKEFNCKYCDKSYGSLGALKMHIRTHTLPCKCKLCGKAFSRPWLLQGHVRTHTGEKPFKCVHCGRAFADRSNLRAHLQTHSDIKKYGCKNCTKTFSRMSLLLKHEEGSCVGLRR